MVNIVLTARLPNDSTDVDNMDDSTHTVAVPEGVVDDFDYDEVPSVIGVEGVSEIVLTASNGLDEGDVIIDTGAGTEIFREDLGMTQWKAEGEMLICGVSVEAAPIVTDTMIMTKFGPVYYSPESVANVISYHNNKQTAHRV